MADTLETKINTFCQYVQDITGRPVLKARRNKNPQLTTPFCSVDYLGGKQVENDTKTYTDAYPNSYDKPIKETVRGLCIGQFSVSSIGGSDAMQVLHKLNCSFYTDTFLFWCKANSFGFSSSGDVQNIAEQILDSAFENRGQLNVFLYMPVPVEFQEDYFTYGKLDIQPSPGEMGTIHDQYGHNYLPE